MKLRSDSWANGDRIPETFAAGRPDGAGGATFSDNLNPHLAWSEVPDSAGSLVLICHDFDMPTGLAGLDQAGDEVPVDALRADFFHWLLVDLPPRAATIEAGSYRRGFTPGGHAGPQSTNGTRQGLNDYTRWFANDTVLRGRYVGYDGPFPPVNDSLVHHCVFTLYAVRFDRLPLEGDFTGHQLRAALAGQVLTEATWSGTYTLNARLLQAGA